MGFLSGIAKKAKSEFRKAQQSGGMSHDEQQAAALQGGSETDYASRAAACCPAEVYMFSGCMDSQTSADVSNVQSFGLPSGSGPSGAGGACTNALLSKAHASGSLSWKELLEDMVSFLKQKGYSQVPCLSTSRKTNLNDRFAITQPGGGRTYSVLVGINYRSHSQGQLSGCVNDVASMKNYITQNGFYEDPNCMRILVDENSSHIRIPTGQPTKANILDSIRWMTRQARPGDTCFFHYSGHGGQQKDTSGDEEDGMDETLIPVDYKTAGVITDDDLYEELCATLPEGVRLVCVMDCCHSGTILDLPYVFVANNQGLTHAASSGGYTAPNPAFNGVIAKFLQMGIEVLGKKYPALIKLQHFIPKQ